MRGKLVIVRDAFFSGRQQWSGGLLSCYCTQDTELKTFTPASLANVKSLNNLSNKYCDLVRQNNQWLQCDAAKSLLLLAQRQLSTFLCPDEDLSFNNLLPPTSDSVVAGRASVEFVSDTSVCTLAVLVNDEPPRLARATPWLSCARCPTSRTRTGCSSTWTAHGSPMPWWHST